MSRDQNLISAAAAGNRWHRVATSDAILKGLQKISEENILEVRKNVAKHFWSISLTATIPRKTENLPFFALNNFSFEDCQTAHINGCPQRLLFSISKFETIFAHSFVREGLWGLGSDYGSFFMRMAPLRALFFEPFSPFLSEKVQDWQKIRKIGSAWQIIMDAPQFAHILGKPLSFRPNRLIELAPMTPRSFFFS